MALQPMLEGYANVSKVNKESSRLCNYKKKRLLGKSMVGDDLSDRNTQSNLKVAKIDIIRYLKLIWHAIYFESA